MKRFEPSIILDDMYKSQSTDKEIKFSFDSMKMFSIDRKVLTYTTAITLPLILAACGGGGGGGAPAPSATPAPPPAPSTPHSDVTVSSSATSVDEGGSVTYTATAGTVGDIDTELSWSVDNGSSDFDSASGTLTLSANSSSGTFTVTATDDVLSEANETFAVSVSLDGSSIFNENLTINISDKTPGTEANAGNYAATSDADTYLYDVTFAADGSITEAKDGNVVITGFDASADTIVLRGAGAPGSTGSPADFATGGSTNVDVASDINGDTVITLGSVNDSTYTITLKGVSDSSSVNIKSVNESADTGRPVVDLSSGTVTAASAGEVFEYSVKFENGVPVAIDGDVTINSFDAVTDRIVLKTETLPAGYGKGNLLSTAGVDVAPGISDLLIAFGPDSGGSSGSIKLDGITKFADVDLVFEVSSPSIKGTRIDLESGSSVVASESNETFVYGASWDGDEIVGADGEVTISGFSIANDKIIVLGSGIPSGYDSSQFKNNTNGTQQIVVDEINNKTTIYFAPEAGGSSSSLTLDGVADTSGNLNIVFGASIGDEPAPIQVDTSTSTDTTTDTTTDTATDTSYTIVNVAVTADDTITATSAAEDFRYEVDAAGISKEGAFTVTIDGFDIASDKLTLVVVGGSSNLTTQEFDGLSGVEVTSDGLSGTQIFFATDSDGQSGTLVLNGVEESFDDTWTATTYTVEILADTNLTG